MFTLSSSLWTLKENPSPKLSQLGEVHGSTTSLHLPSHTLNDSPSIASSEFSTSPQEETILQRSRSSHSFRLLPFHRRGSRSLSPSPSDHSRSESAPPYLREAAHFRKASSSSSDQNHQHAWKIISIAPGHKPKHKNQKDNDKPSASRVGRARTDPYGVPYSFPSPLSPGAYDYVRLVQLDRKLVLDPDFRAHRMDRRRNASFPPGKRVRSV
ncbi:hypothetical protein B0F90DRAFT_164451 [Multifurca ochricompacta]|uniref:Uncharacterized protein n=1 Tax=Multifurca ochricompacta TaxID=376703 RepID=A0AAD4QSF2_9AGAM|nr:hypothetical protein B0F90DRAFT_164451 [Multifurca ochricompacta]